MITFTGLSSVLDRTLFTNRGPIVKRPADLLAGSNLRIMSETQVSIPTGSFNSLNVGQQIAITGSAGGRNDGVFYIKKAINNQLLQLENASFDISDVGITTNLVVGLTNELKARYNSHRIQKITQGTTIIGVHGTDDTVNIVTSPIAVDLASAIIMLNDIRTQFNLHVVDVSGVPPVHKVADTDDVILSPAATSLASAVILVNDLRRKFESHRQNLKSHQVGDSVNRVTISEVKPITGLYPGPLTGPFSWILKDPRPGMVADDSADVDVIVNGSPAAVDAVFGLLGAVVLTNKPSPTDIVSINYAFLNNPPAKLLRLNSPEFNLNQAGNRGYAGFPEHRYRSRSFLIDPVTSPDFTSPYQPQKVGWKYKGLERRYSAVLNDPSTLLLNVPTNRLAYPVLFQTFFETTIRYDPITLPQNAHNPWTLEGDGTFILAPGGNQLTIVDSNIQTGPSSQPPFFTHTIDMRAPAILSAAFRMFVEESVNDGVFTGVSFGVSDGQKVAVIGFILTDAINLSSAIVMVNDAKAKFNSHLTNLGSHIPNDPDDTVVIVDATDLVSLVILLNDLKSKMNLHMAKGGASGVHIIPDTIDPIVSPDADDLPTSLTLVNEIRTKLNAHETQPGIHFVNDVTNVVNQVRQAGILTNRGFAEFQESWNAASVDWTVLTTYRIFRDSDGDISLFLSGGLSPITTASVTELPSISDLDGQFDPLQQIFFGSIGRNSTSTSNWAFVRSNMSPVDANLIGDNKRVDYEADTLPELDPQAPWITVGQGGVERVASGILTIDSTASAPSASVQALGLSSGAYRGCLRLEPILSVNTACSFEFAASIDFWTHSLDNRAAGVFLDDENFSVQFCFLQFSPSPATITGSSTEPFPMVSGDSIVISLDGAPPFTVNFSPSDSTAVNVASTINTAAGFTLASAAGGRVTLTSSDVGIQSSIQIISGSSLSKLGFSPGVYRGKDSNPEPRVSWFGENLPDLDSPVWTRAGTQSSEMLGRTMRLTDSDVSDYVVFNLADPVVTNQAFNSSVDWKMDCRFAVLSFVPGDSIPAAPPYNTYHFCGALVSVDEGPSGKSLELQTAIDPITNNKYLNLVSFNTSTGSLDVKAQYAFNWGDGQTHSYDVYTSKNADSIFVLADGSLLSPLSGQPSPTYSGLNTGLAGPSLSFGSGSAPVNGSDMRSAMSVVDWNTVTVFRDSKISDPSASSRRFVGIFMGGDPTILDSYYLYQVDWTALHTYRIVRDPVSAVSVYVDGGQVPVISTNYDSLRLPSSSTSFLKGITSGHQAVAFGSFNPQEIVRTRWDFIKYSIGKLTLSDRLISPGQVTNRANAVASPDHLFTAKTHQHFGFRIYSGGTPLDDFMSDADVAAFTILGEGTPPVPKTQNLESRGGLTRVVTPVENIPSVDLVNTKGFISDLEDDIDDVVTEPSATTVSDAISDVISIANDVQSKYNSHRVQPGLHVSNDLVNASILPAALDLSSAIALLNELKAKFNAHRTQPGIHDFDDNQDIVTSADATDIDSAVVLADDLIVQYTGHRNGGPLHITPDVTNIVTAADASDITSLAILADEVRVQMSAHVLATSFHFFSDILDAETILRIPGLGYGSVQADLVTVENPTIPLGIGNSIEFLTGPNAGSFRVVIAVGAGFFTASAPYATPDSSPSSFTRIVAGQPVLDLPSIIGLINDMKLKFNRHRTLIESQVELHEDLDIRYAVVSPDAFDLNTAITLLNELKSEYNLHRVGNLYHFGFSPVLSVSSIDGPTVTALTLAADLLNQFNMHLVRPRTHVTEDIQDHVFLPPPSDLASLILTTNQLKLKFNIHRTADDVHVTDDTVNVVTSPDAVDLITAVDLLNEIRTKYELHRVQPGVHGGTVFIRLDPPSRVLYEGMKFFRTPTGEPGHVSPFSDDETWHIDGFKAQQDQTLTFTGAALPENAQLVGNLTPPFNIVGGETITIQVDQADPVLVTFQAGDTTSGAVVSRINSAPGLPSSLASSEIDGRIRLISPTSGPSSKVMILSGSAIFLLGLDVPQYTPWFILSDDPSSVSVTMMSAGPIDFMRYGTIGTTRTAYESRSGLPDSISVKFEMTLSIRINSVFSPSTNLDSGIYVGFSGIAGPFGFTAGIGFEKLGSFRFVKVQDLNSGKTLFRRPFDWEDGNFHTYRLVRDLKRNSLQLIILN